MKKRLKIVAAVLACVMFAGVAATLTSCGKSLATAPTITTPLVVAYSPFSEKFSPYYADTAYDSDVAGMTQLSLLTTDRAGGIIYNAIKGENVEYNGTKYNYKGISNIKVDQKKNNDGSVATTTYKIELKKGVLFSDGVEMTADDIIFNYYVFLDPAYVGSTTLSSYSIVGLKNYQTQTTDEVYEKYSKMVKDIYAAGEDHQWSSSDAWTQELQTAYWDLMKQTWKDDNQAIVDYVFNNYLGYSQDYFGMSGEEIAANEGLKVAYGMVMWGFGTKNEDGTFTTAAGKTYDLTSTFPTIDDYYESTYQAYGGDPDAYFGTEAADDTDVHGTTDTAFILQYGSKDEAMGGAGVPNISGIKKTGKYKVEVTTEGFEAPAIYSICGISVAPMHYYGDETKFDYDNNKFGHDFGDLTSVQAKTNFPMGAGPYKFVEYKDKIVYFEANEHYFKGCPKIATIQFKEMSDDDKITSLTTGDADVSDPSGSKAKFQQIRDINGGELDGNIITTNAVDNLGYGYIGLNADTINVGGKSSSEESKNLRKAIATVIAVYRDVAINSYYGDAASVINYPISNTSWAAPQKSDADYKVAFSVDVDGNDIYTADMNAEAKYAAALEASKGFFKAAGYTYDEGSGKFTAAPDGAKLAYEALVPGDGTGDHPNFQVLSNAAAALGTIGITLNINDLTDSSILWNRLDAHNQEIWTAAWGATIDPDMYQVYHSSGIVGRGGSDSNHYGIDDANLDQLIIDARQSADQDYRKSTYKACLDIIIDWALEVPSYQRQNIVIFSTERVNIDTITPDITTYWGWMNDIENLEVYQAQ